MKASETITKENRHDKIKSPSDTTLYTPGLRKTPENLQNFDPNGSVIDQILDFVDNIWMNQRLCGNEMLKQS